MVRKIEMDLTSIYEVGWYQKPVLAVKAHHRYIRCKFLDLYITASNITLYIHAFFNTNIC